MWHFIKIEPHILPAANVHIVQRQLHQLTLNIWPWTFDLSDKHLLLIIGGVLGGLIIIGIVVVLVVVILKKNKTFPIQDNSQPSKSIHSKYDKDV